MKLIRSTPSSLSVSDFDEWFRHPFAGLPSLGHLFSQLGEVFPGVPGDRLAVDVHEDKDNYIASFEVPRREERGRQNRTQQRPAHRLR